MTNKEAAKTINNVLRSPQLTPNVCDALKLARKALKKQIPKKPTHDASIQSCFTCPICNNVVNDAYESFAPDRKIRVVSPFCKHCGQALDWSELQSV